MISLVMRAWRTRLYVQGQAVDHVARVLGAASIAVICAAKNAAFDSSSAR
jgi:hypothetical protein